MKKCSIVAVAGLPNSGKSTLVNLLVGVKISIISPKPQTTRTQIRGIITEGNTQLIFIDTPGILTGSLGSGQEKLQKEMSRASWGGIQSSDMILLMIDAEKKSADGIELCKKIAREKIPAMLAVNKIDKISPKILLPLVAELNAAHTFAATFMISATTGSGVDDLKKYLLENAKPAPWLYAEDEITDAPARSIAEEITREKIFLKFHQEVPYFSMIETEKWEEDEKRITIHQTIIVQRESQKKIIVGRAGAGVKEIGMTARKELEEFFGKKINLFLFVKVQENHI